MEVCPRFAAVCFVFWRSNVCITICKKASLHSVRRRGSAKSERFCSLCRTRTLGLEVKKIHVQHGVGYVFKPYLNVQVSSREKSGVLGRRMNVGDSFAGGRQGKHSLCRC